MFWAFDHQRGNMSFSVYYRKGEALPLAWITLWFFPGKLCKDPDTSWRPGLWRSETLFAVLFSPAFVEYYPCLSRYNLILILGKVCRAFAVLEAIYFFWFVTGYFERPVKVLIQYLRFRLLDFMHPLTLLACIQSLNVFTFMQWKFLYFGEYERTHVSFPKLLWRFRMFAAKAMSWNVPTSSACNLVFIS